MRTWRAAQIVLINGLVFCGLFLSLEVSYRVWLYFRNCETICRNPTFLTRIDAYPVPYEFLKRDQLLGYVPADGDYLVHHRTWNNNSVTIRNGVRLNGNSAEPTARGAILALGDSYTFGDEVSDDETWPAILERLTHHRVVNGGVSGYGTAQALLRGTQLLSAGNYYLVILSILIGSDGGDLARDRLPYSAPHVSRPVVIRDGDVIRQTTAEEQQQAISICTNIWAGPLLWSHIAKRLLVDRCRVNDPRAATVDEITEYVTARLAALPMNKMIVLQHGNYIDDAVLHRAKQIQRAAERHGVPVVDTRAALTQQPLDQIYNGYHHSKRGNEIVARVIASELER